MTKIRTVLIFGATSALGERLARSYAGCGARLLLVGRNRQSLEAVAANLRVGHGVEAMTFRFDASRPESAGEAARAALAAGGMPDLIIFAHGDNAFPDAPYRPEELRRVLAVNFESIADALAELLPALERQPGTAIAIVSSVAGERGRKGNFAYGAAKSALNVYTQGLRAKLYPAGVRVLTVKLGWVDTRLSYGLVPQWLAASPEYAAARINRAIERRREVVYVPWFWRWIALVLRAIPEKLFKRLSIR